MQNTRESKNEKGERTEAEVRTPPTSFLVFA